MQRMFQIAMIIIAMIISWSFGSTKKWVAFGPSVTPMPKKDFSGWSANGLGRIFDIEASTTHRDEIWICSPNGGLFYTKNKGKKWKNIKLPCSGGAIHIERVELTKNKYQMFVASNVSMANTPAYSYGIFSTFDNGKHWDTIKLLTPVEYKLSTIGAMKWTNDRLYYTINGAIHIYHNGITTIPHEVGFNIQSIKVSPSNPKQLYFCGEGIVENHDLMGNYNYVMQPKSLGDVYRAKKCDLAIESKGITVIAHEQKGNYQYNLSKDYHLTNKQRLNASIDVFRTAIEYDSTRKRFLIGGIRLYSHYNNQTSQISFPYFPKKQFMHDDIRAITFDKDNNILVGTDAGISYSDDEGSRWLNINGCGLNITEVYDFDVSKKQLVAGAQDLSSFVWDKSEKEWYHLSSLYGDGGTCLIIKDTWILMKGAQMVQSKNAGKQFYGMHMPMSFSSFNPSMRYTEQGLFVGAKHLWKYNKGNWNNISLAFESNYAISSFIIKDELILVSKEDPVWSNERMRGKLFRSMDGGKKWVDITPAFQALSYREITNMCFSRSNDKIYACLGGFDNPKGTKEKVYKTIDSGRTWNNISYNLPNVPCTIVKDIPGIGLMVGTDKGLFYLSKEKQWLRYGKGLPECPITHITLYNKHLWVSTYGRGIWVMK